MKPPQVIGKLLCCLYKYSLFSVRTLINRPTLFPLLVGLSVTSFFILHEELKDDLNAIRLDSSK
jgi:hypothetical protein